jgi:hypothetical protein
MARELWKSICYIAHIRALSGLTHLARRSRIYYQE